MNSFQKIVLFAAIVILIIALIFIGISLRYSTDQSWPPMTPECPDYWVIDGSGNNARCINVQNLGSCRAPTGDKYLTMNFNNSAFSGPNSMCAKYTWATKCGVAWDGITYGARNPCQTA